MNQDNRWERRDNKRSAKRKMKVNGAGTKVTQRIIMEKAQEANSRLQTAP